MIDLSRIFYLLIGVFLVLTMVANLNLDRFPKLPGDIYIDKPGVRVYIPFVSAISISVILTLLFNFFRK